MDIVNGPLLSTFLLRCAVRTGNGKLYYAAMQDAMKIFYLNKNPNYIKICSFELYMIRAAPPAVKDFIFRNLFQPNLNHNDQNTAEGLDYKLEEWNKVIKQFVPSNPTYDDWIKLCSFAPTLKKLSDNQAEDYKFEHLLEYSEPRAPDYNNLYFRTTFNEHNT